MAKTLFKRFAGRFSTVHPAVPKDHEIYLSDNGSTLTLMFWDATNSKWVGNGAMTTSTSTSTSTTTTSTSTTT